MKISLNLLMGAIPFLLFEATVSPALALSMLLVEIGTDMSVWESEELLSPG
jgi:hypothetical protein